MEPSEKIGHFNLYIRESIENNNKQIYQRLRFLVVRYNRYQFPLVGPFNLTVIGPGIPKKNSISGGFIGGIRTKYRSLFKHKHPKISRDKMDSDFASEEDDYQSPAYSDNFYDKPQYTESICSDNILNKNKIVCGPCEDNGLYPNNDKCVAYKYGSDPIQVIDCHFPKGNYAPLVVLLIHDGYWRSGHNRTLEDAIGNDLLRFKIVVCNLDYRSIDNGGGYQNTFYDVANGTDLLRTIGKQHSFNNNHVVILGHSAGGQLGGYLTGRVRLTPNQPGYSRNSFRPIGFVSQAGFNDMWDGFYISTITGTGVVSDFLGESYEIYPERYVLSSVAASDKLTIRFT